jgi:CheY-like chemotaxis protein
MRAVSRILVVDDEPHALSALRELLRDEGYEVDCARDGAAAARRLAAFQPDLVLSDVEMPGTDGLALATAARAAPNAPAVVLMSARQAPPGAGAPFVQKPIVLSELLETVARALAQRRR